MGLFDQGTSSSGSQQSASSVSDSWSNTAGAAASAWSAQQAEAAHQRQLELLEKTQEYNSKEAQKTRDWQTEMANTIYTRSVKNMIEAGINPVLAAGMGLSGAGVSSGATANVGTPSTFMGQSIAEQNSSAHSESESQGSGWSKSESGIITALTGIGQLANSLIAALGSAHAIEVNINGLNDLFNNQDNYKGDDNTYDTGDSIKGLAEVFTGDRNILNWLSHEINPLNSPLFNRIREVGNLRNKINSGKYKSVEDYYK